jgi:hypothetical protein
MATRMREGARQFCRLCERSFSWGGVGRTGMFRLQAESRRSAFRFRSAWQYGRLEQAELAALEGKEFFFNGKAAAVAGELAVAADHAMAGNDDGDGVRSIG